MNQSTITAALLGFALGIFGAVNAAPPLGTTQPVRIVSAIDGDTLIVEWTRSAHVRLLDCYAPETRTKDAAEKARGLAAKAFLGSKVDGKDGVLFVPYQRDVGKETTLGRVLGRVYVDGDDVSETMIAAGYATREKLAK